MPAWSGVARGEQWFKDYGGELPVGCCAGVGGLGWVVARSAGLRRYMMNGYSTFVVNKESLGNANMNNALRIRRQWRLSPS